MTEALGQACAALVGMDPQICEQFQSYCSCSCDGYAAGTGGTGGWTGSGTFPDMGTGDTGMGPSPEPYDPGMDMGDFPGMPSMPSVVDGCLSGSERTLKDDETFIYFYGLEDNQDCFWIFECSGAGEVPHLEFMDFHTYVFALRDLPCALLSLARYSH